MSINSFPQKSKMKRTLLNLLFAVILFSLFIGALEIVLRTTHLFGAALSWIEPDPFVGYRSVADSHYWYNKENNHPITGRINSYRWRDKEWSQGKPSNTFRIAVLGDSMVEAFQVESDRTFLSLTEYQLNRTPNQDIKVELMNFGRSGFTQSEELLVLQKEIVQFSPDMVLAFFLPSNDIEDVSKETAEELRRPFYHISENGQLILDTSFIDLPQYKIFSFLSPFKQHSALLSLIKERYDFFRGRVMGYKYKMMSKSKKEEILQDKKIAPPFLSLCTKNPNVKFLKNYQLNKILIKAMAEFSKQKGIKFMLVTWDIPSYIPEFERKFVAIDSTFNANYFEDDLGEYTRLLNIEYLGLQRIFRRAYENTGSPLHWETPHWAVSSMLGAFSPHLNYEGHKVVADALVNKLKPIIYSKVKGD